MFVYIWMFLGANHTAAKNKLTQIIKVVNESNFRVQMDAFRRLRQNRQPFFYVFLSKVFKLMNEPHFCVQMRLCWALAAEYMCICI